MPKVARVRVKPALRQLHRGCTKRSIQVQLILVLFNAVACSSNNGADAGYPAAGISGAQDPNASGGFSSSTAMITGGTGGSNGIPTPMVDAATSDGSVGSGEAGPTTSTGDTGVPMPDSGPSLGPTPGDFTVDLSLSPVIGTVGIVEWSTTARVDSAHIDFGRDAKAFELSAPVDLSAPNYRTLLLGMKPSTTYYVQIFVDSGGSTLTSEVLSLQTDPLPNGLPTLNINDVDPSGLYGGFTVTCVSGLGGGGFGAFAAGPRWALIFDRDGDYVWAYNITGTPVAGCSRARMSFDGKDMWIGNFSNVTPDGALMRVTMDGLETKDYSLPARHHDFTVLPNNHILYQEQENGGGGMGPTEGPDLIKELDPETGQSTLIYHENTDFSVQIAQSGAHTNYIEYVPRLDAISFSLRHTSTIAVISYPDAELLMVFGGPLSMFDFQWNGQHGHEVLENSILVFNNNGTNGGSSILEYEFDLATHTGRKILDYSSGNSSGAFGDVQRLANGNTFITYSTTGVFHEINAAGGLLREITTDPVGYSQHRLTLYGPPPPHAN